MRTAIVLIVFAAVFIGLTVDCYRQESATADEPQQLTTGYTALVLKDYRLDPEHPPLLRMWAALPLWMMSDVRLNTNAVSWTSVKPREFPHQFLYVDNDADRLLNRARFMNAVLGVLLGILLFCWSRELFGFWPAVVALGLFCFEPNTVAHFGLVTTDSVACLIFGTLYFLWRTARRLTSANLVGLTVFFALAQAGKFTALILYPIALLVLVVHALRNGAWPCTLGRWDDLATRAQRLMAVTGIWLLLAVASYVTLWAVYSFRYAPSPGGTGLDRIVAGPVAHRRVPKLAAAIDWIDEHHLLPNVYTQGFLLGQAAAQDRTAYLLGQISYTGWWYYFPVAVLVKTPVALLILFFAGLALCGRECTSGRFHDDLFFLIPLFLYLGASLPMKLNIGIRHILPLYPLVVLVGGKTFAAAFASKRRQWLVVVAALCLLEVAEVAAVHPHELAFFNLFVGGPKNGYKYLADSNLDWGQDLKNLKKWMDANHVDRINLSYFGSADPVYYGIACNYLRGSPAFIPTNQIVLPTLPGLVAVSVNNLTGVNLQGEQFYKPLLDREPVTVIGYSIRIYQADRPWW